MKLLTLATILALALPFAPNLAHADSLALAVADGKAWNGAGPGGRKVKLTFNPDGSARLQMGIMKKSFSWSATEDGFCLNGLPDGGKCVRLERTATGFVGYEGDEITVKLDR